MFRNRLEGMSSHWNQHIFQDHGHFDLSHISTDFIRQAQAKLKPLLDITISQFIGSRLMINIQKHIV